MSQDYKKEESAIEEWMELLGSSHVVTGKDAQNLFPCTSGIKHRVAAVLRPDSREQVQSIVGIARQYNIPVYPVSTGKNWGYGGGYPTVDHCAVIDLCRMDRILTFNEEFGYVTVEPGVTQKQLYDYISEKNLDFLVPVTGSSPDCSLIGNALERGYGVTPICDHFGGIISLEAVMPDGRMYKPLLGCFKEGVTDNLYRWGVGPYLDGLFSQGNFGIVTQATITLARKPEAVIPILFRLKDTADLAAFVDETRALKTKYGALISSFKFFDQLYGMIASGVDLPVGVSEDEVSFHAKKNNISPWNGYTAIYGPSSITHRVAADIKRRLSSYCCQFFVASPFKIDVFSKVQVFSSALGLSSLMPQNFKVLMSVYQYSLGKPQDYALKLPYWRNSKCRFPQNGPVDPGADECGLIWYAPLVPYKGEDFKRIVEMARGVFLKYGLNAMFTVTSMNEQCLTCLIPILFDRNTETEKAHACMDALMEEGFRNGWMPYRVPVDYFHHFKKPESEETLQIIKSLKSALDENNLIAPNRYS